MSRELNASVVDRGTGPALVLIPGLQGRWEYMRPTVEALAAFFRVITFSLDGSDLDTLAAQAARALDERQIDRAIVCGVSFGGLVAVRFAARYPARTAALVLASTPAPVLQLRRRHRIYLKAPWLFGPLFVVESPLRLRPEIAVAIPDRAARRRFSLDALRTFLTARLSLTAMAARARVISGCDIRPDCAAITAPTLVVTGEAALDHVVPVEGSSTYLRLIANASGATLERTGHLGSVTRHAEFAAIVRTFVERRRHAAA